jgi:hypothetical protein
MSNAVIFLGGFTLSLIACGLMARCVWWDSLAASAPGKAVAVLLAPHAFRHVGLLVLVPGVAGEPITKTHFATMLAYGDAVVAPLALVGMWLWLSGSRAAKGFTWLFSIIASLDLVNAIYGALTLPVYDYAIGAFWLILTCLVPLLIVTQVLIFFRLIKG